MVAFALYCFAEAHSALVRRALGLAVAGGAVMVIVPATGMGATVPVSVGNSSRSGDFDATAYQPRAVTIHKGDSIKFEWGGFHTVSARSFAG